MPITDTFTMSITIIQHGNAHIVLPVTYPTSVEANTAFNITYTIQNNGTISDLLYAELKVGGSVVPGSHWEQTIAANGTVTKTFAHPGISVATTFVLEAGRV
jgi:hypothetical protein